MQHQRFHSECVARPGPPLACQKKELIDFFMVGFPTLMANIADTWGFETMGVIAAHLGAVEAATWAILMSIYNVLFSPFIAMSSAASAKIGNALGRGEAAAAKEFVRAMWVLSLSFASFSCLLLVCFGGEIYSLYTSDPVLIANGRRLSLLGGVTVFLDGAFYVQQGAFRGCGRQMASSVINCITMWVIAVPLACLFSASYDVLGILFGLTLGVGIGAPLQAYYLLFKVDWDKCARVASKGEGVAIPSHSDEDDEMMDQRVREAEDDRQSDNESVLSL